MSRPLVISDISNLVPINSLTFENQTELTRLIEVQQLATGDALIDQGQRDDNTYYLISGEALIIDQERIVGKIGAKYKEGLCPLIQAQPRPYTIVAKTDIEYICVKNEYMDMLLTWDQTKSYVVSEIDEKEESTDWMTQILSSEIFQRIPPANIQKLFLQLEHFSAKAGENIINQNDEGDFYYILKSGKCEVFRLANAKEIRLATLNAGDHFGEEALISSEKRNATVRMATDGSLMRLSREDFDELLKEPVMDSISYSDAGKLVSEGGVWIDVRLEHEHAMSCIKGSVNIPLYILRLRMANLDRDTNYIIYCDTGKRSATASYLLSQKGFSVILLEGGINAIPKEEFAA